MQERKIRSFVRREGRMTPGQKRALDELWPQYGIDFQEQLLDLDNYFPQSAPVVLEIGFGMGHSLLAMAMSEPNKNFLGIEVHRPGVGTLLAEIEKHQVTNLRVICHDAVEVLDTMIAPQALARIQIFFPDPWPKKRHHKRRLIQSEFIEAIHPKLVPGGLLHLATDWQEYAEHMLEVLSACSALNNCVGNGNYAPRPESRPLTKFEKRGERLGHGVWDLLFTAKTK